MLLNNAQPLGGPGAGYQVAIERALHTKDRLARDVRISVTPPGSAELPGAAHFRGDGRTEAPQGPGSYLLPA